MEGSNVEGEARGQAQPEGWRAWEAAPRDGPGIFVVDTRVLDRDGEVRGRWLDPNVEPEVLYHQLQTLLGREPVEGTWAVIDQVGLGPLMLPETLDVDEVRLSVKEAAAESDWRGGARPSSR